MIDAREQIGTPVITDCPSYVEFQGVTYEIAADAFSWSPGLITFEADAEGSLFDKLYSYTAFRV